MISFRIDDMTCGHCVATVTRALHAADDRATVRVDLATHRVDIEPTTADAATLAEALRDAGYTPVPA